MTLARDPSTGRFSQNGKQEAVELSPAQVAILQYVADGKTNEDIALLTNTSEPAIRMRLARIMDMTGTASRAAAVAWALRRNVIR